MAVIFLHSIQNRKFFWAFSAVQYCMTVSMITVQFVHGLAASDCFCKLSVWTLSSSHKSWAKFRQITAVVYFYLWSTALLMGRELWWSWVPYSTSVYEKHNYVTGTVISCWSHISVKCKITFVVQFYLLLNIIFPQLHCGLWPWMGWL